MRIGDDPDLEDCTADAAKNLMSPKSLRDVFENGFESGANDGKQSQTDRDCRAEDGRKECRVLAVGGEAAVRTDGIAHGAVDEPEDSEPKNVEPDLADVGKASFEDFEADRATESVKGNRGNAAEQIGNQDFVETTDAALSSDLNLLEHFEIQFKKLLPASNLF